MTLDHVAIWTSKLDQLKDFYVKYFNGKANKKYVNNTTGFESYFLTFDSGARMELMQKSGTPPNLNDPTGNQHLGLIHIAFGVNTMAEVNDKASELTADGFKIMRGPRRTGDGYYEIETSDPDGNRIEVAALYVE